MMIKVTAVMALLQVSTRVSPTIPPIISIFVIWHRHAGCGDEARL